MARNIPIRLEVFGFVIIRWVLCGHKYMQGQITLMNISIHYNLLAPFSWYWALFRNPGLKKITWDDVKMRKYALGTKLIWLN